MSLSKLSTIFEDFERDKEVTKSRKEKENWDLTHLKQYAEHSSPHVQSSRQLKVARKKARRDRPHRVILPATRWRQHRLVLAFEGRQFVGWSAAPSYWTLVDWLRRPRNWVMRSCRCCTRTFLSLWISTPCCIHCKKRNSLFEFDTLTSSIVKYFCVAENNVNFVDPPLDFATYFIWLLKWKDKIYLKVIY